MMWKTLILFAVTSVVLAGKINNKRNANYEFHIKHDYDYLKRHHKLEHHKDETEAKPQEDEAAQVEEVKEEVKEEEQNEEVANAPEQANESDVSNAEPETEEPKNEEEEENEYPGYEFLYRVIDPHTHDKKGQHEKKVHDEVKGVYWLLQPDGYKRTVDYHADKHSGFHAKVDFSKSEEDTNEGDHSKPKSEYYVKTYHGPKKYIPITENQEEEQEQDKQEESAQHVPIYVI